MPRRASRGSRTHAPNVRRGRPRNAASPEQSEGAVHRPEHAPLLSQDPPLSPFDRWIRSLDRSPRAQWLFYLALPVGLIAGLHGLSWVCGTPPGDILSPALTAAAIVSVVLVGAIHHANRVAGRALFRFRPALAVSEDEFRRHHHDLTTMPATASWAALPAGAAVLWSVIATDPSFYGMLSAGLCNRPALLLIGWINSVLMVLAVYVSVRYLVQIRRLHAEAPTINLFERGPLFAFSTLSSHLALAFAVFSYGWVLAFPTSLKNLPTAVYLLGINLPLILVIFIYPLYGMHVRMVEEKQRLLQDSARRIQAGLAAFRSEDVARAPAGVDPHRRLTSLIEEENYLRKIPTWPWEPGTLTAVLTAVFLPLMLVVAQQVVRRYFSG